MEFGNLDKQKKKHKEPVRPIYYAISAEAYYKNGLTITDTRAQALYFFLYLTGCRINEATDFMPSRIRYALEDGFIFVRMKTLKARIEVRRYREVPIPLVGARCLELQMWEIVKKYLSGFGPYDRPFAKWKNMSNYLARTVEMQTEAQMKGLDGVWRMGVLSKHFNPHFARHCRATDLKEKYNYEAHEMCAYFGWANMNMALRYGKLKQLKDAFNKTNNNELILKIREMEERIIRLQKGG